MTAARRHPVVRAQYRTAHPSVLMADGTEWGLLNTRYRYGRFGAGYTMTYPYRKIVVRQVGTVTRWGNPWQVVWSGDDWRWIIVNNGKVKDWNNDADPKPVLVASATESHKSWIGSQPPSYFDGLGEVDALSCRCKLGTPCHADALVDSLNKRLGLIS